MKTKELKALLDEASNEEASAETLASIWYNTRSSKVRKAIASNPNASPEVLRMAARLYLEEVLQNPAFEMLKLFDSDNWVKMISDANEDPTAFFVKHGKYNTIGRSGGDLFLRAMLVSDKLTPEALNSCVHYGQKSALDKALQNKTTFQTIQTIVRYSIYNSEKYYNPFEIEPILCLYKRKVLNEQDIWEALSRYGLGSVSAPKRVYCDFMYSIWNKYKAEKQEHEKYFLTKLFAKFLMVSRGHVAEWLHYSDKFFGDEFMKFISKVLKMIGEAGNKVVLHDHKRSITRIICSHLSSRFYDSERNAEDVEKIYEFFSSNYILDEILAYGKNTMNLRSSSLLEEFDKCKDEIKYFFVKMQAMGTWAVAMDSDLRFKIINDANEYAYSKYGVSKKLVFNSCSMRKVVATDESVYIVE